MISIISNKRSVPLYTSGHDIYAGAITMLAKFYDTPLASRQSIFYEFILLHKRGIIMKRCIEEMLLKYLETIQPICEIGGLAPYRERSRKTKILNMYCL